MKNITKMVAALLAFAAVPAAGSAVAQSQSPITLSGDVKAVETSVDAAGNTVTRLVEPDVIVPGDRLVFTTDYANNGAEAVDNFVVTNAVPDAVRLAGDADPALTVSVDGGETWGALSSLTVAGEDGTMRAAAHADVTHVRWTLESVAPGDNGRVEYPAIIR
ncbi:hypothetical protein NAP1_03810 [Erythrobacter sp. NAP1]|uniref:hypothetical protein n=1 Tax=Erythrobacter sp. NAP1 TaxID=237727 RepID=UPI0000686A0B|nr:hypothetical protein [Erythrobacter sp. NAP1]EAQ29868.1 hypothetical protein NAP1_03810 [Erythrobacter sp. NAP1]